MRHLWSLLAGIVIAPLAWLALAVGENNNSAEYVTFANKGIFNAGDFVRPTIALLIAGLLVGLIACLRISPAGPLLVGVAFVLPGIMMMAAPVKVYGYFAYTFHVPGVHGQGKGDLSAPLSTGTALVLGALLLVAAASAKRWRTWPKTVGAHSVAAKNAEPMAYSAPAWTPSSQPDEGSTAPVETPASTLEEPAVVEERPVVYSWDRADETPEPATHSVASNGPLGSPWDTPPREGSDSK